MENRIVPNESTPEPFVFNWTLNPEDFKKTIFDKKKCVEYINVSKVYGFIKNEMGINYGGIDRYGHLPYANELEWVKKYKTIYDKKSKQFKTGYYLPKHKWGRIIPIDYLSMSVAHRPTRHSLCEDNYIDIDMINAQPTITREICKHHGLENTHLNYYIDNRNDILQLIMTNHQVVRDIAKNLPICLLFGGSYDGWMKVTI